MPTSYPIDSARRLAISRLWAPVTDEELRDQQIRLRSGPEFDPVYWQLIGVRGMSTARVSSGVLSSLAQTAHGAPGLRRAVVADDDAAFGLARVFSAWAAAQGSQVRVFRDLASAAEWLEL